MFNIAIDGFMACGKSSLAKALAKKLNFRYLDTGAIFRTVAVGFTRTYQGEPTDKLVDKFLENNKIDVAFQEDGQHMFLNGEDVTGHLRTEEISAMASKLSAFSKVREQMRKIAIQFAKENDCVMDGQVCAIEIMPNADVKFFLTANENVRAERRYAELKTKFPNLKLKDVLKELQERYDRDTTRADNPLKPTDESIIVDNTDMNLEETIEYCYNIITKVLNKEHVINVTIDGYVCSGKSTIAKMLAKRIGFKVFDTGAVYRGIACAYDAMGCDDEMRDDEKYVKKFADQIEIKIDFIDGLQHVYVNGIDHTANLRTEHISFLSSQLARYQFIREKVLKLQRSYASNNNLVMEGRDIGSFVLPNAEFKFFCTADDNVRAQRRYDQQKLMGNDVSFDEILKELKARDYSDIHRDHGAIKVTPTSIILDTTNLTLDESVDFCIKEISKKYPEFKNC